LYGCVRIGINSEGQKQDGGLLDSIVVDEPQLEVLASGVLTPEPPEGAQVSRHGDRDDPPPRVDVGR